MPDLPDWQNRHGQDIRKFCPHPEQIIPRLPQIFQDVVVHPSQQAAYRSRASDTDTVIITTSVGFVHIEPDRQREVHRSAGPAPTLPAAARTTRPTPRFAPKGSPRPQPPVWAQERRPGETPTGSTRHLWSCGQFRVNLTIGLGGWKLPNASEERLCDPKLDHAGAIGTRPPTLRDLFQGTPALHAVIDKVAMRRRVEAGSVLFRKDDEADTFYLIDEGEIEISVTSPDGRKLSLEILTAPQLFGEIGLFAGRRTADATALTVAVLRSVRRSHLLASIRTDPDLALVLIDLLCARLRIVSDKLEERAFQPLPVRLARRLLHLLDTFTGPDGTIRLSQAELADFVGTTREAVAKTVGQWRKHGWLDLSRGAIHVRDRAALQAIASGQGE